jgi:fermentation-respiration switch protein FrsA (DUF1100 family)
VVPPEQAAPLRDGLEAFLDASAVHRTDPDKARQMFATLASQPSRIAEPSATLLRHVHNRDVRALGATLLPHLAQLGQDPSLSPDRSPAPAAPVYLLHGIDDNVIPAVESTRLAEYLREKTRVRHLISGFLTHADVAGTPGVKDMWGMVRFWKDLLAEY